MLVDGALEGLRLIVDAKRKESARFRQPAAGTTSACDIRTAYLQVKAVVENTALSFTCDQVCRSVMLAGPL